MTGSATARDRVVMMTTELFARGGVQRVGREAIAALAPLGRMSVWSLRDHSLPADGDLPQRVSYRLAGGSRARLAAWGVAAAATRCDAHTSVLVMHMHVAPIAIPLLVRGARVNVFLHGVESWRPLTAAERYVIARCGRVITNSHHTADRFIDCNPRFKRAAVEVCPLGIPPVQQHDDDRSDENVALMVARMSSEDRYKGHERIVRAWPLVRVHVPDAELVLVGDGDDRPRLEAVARDAGVGDVVRFVGDVGDEALDTWYRRCAFFVLPSDREGFGLVLLEAMRAGKACIAARGAAAEIVVDEVTGLVVAADDQGALATAMTRLFLNRELRARFGRNGQARFRQTFTSRHFADRLRQLVAGPMAPGHAA